MFVKWNVNPTEMGTKLLKQLFNFQEQIMKHSGLVNTDVPVVGPVGI